MEQQEQVPSKLFQKKAKQTRKKDLIHLMFWMIEMPEQNFLNQKETESQFFILITFCNKYVKQKQKKTNTNTGLQEILALLDSWCLL